MFLVSELEAMRLDDSSACRRKGRTPQRRPQAPSGSTPRSPGRSGASGPAPKSREKSRFRPGPKALMMIRKYQKSSELPRTPHFAQMVREASRRFSSQELGWQIHALLALQEAAEAFLATVLADADLFAVHVERASLFSRDVHLARRIRGVGNLDVKRRCSFCPAGGGAELQATN